MAGDPSQMFAARTVLLALLVTVGSGLLHFARPVDSATWYRSGLPGGVEYSWNPDSPAFARIVVRFPEEFVLTPGGRARILRPLYVAPGWILYNVAGPIIRPALPGPLVRKVRATMARANHPENWIGIDPEDLTVAWICLVGVNVLILVLSLILVYSALSVLFGSALSAALTATAATQVDFVRYVFVPHTEPFNILIPALFLFALVRRWMAGSTDGASALALGIAQLGKPIAFPAANWVVEPLRRFGSPGWKQSVKYLGLIAAPALVYVTTLIVLGLPPYSPEVSEHNQVVWMLDYIRQGDVFGLVGHFAGNLGKHLGQAAYVFIAPIGTVAALYLFRGMGGVSRRLEMSEAIRFHAALYFVIGVLFWSSVGLMSARLTSVYYPLVILILGGLAHRLAVHPVRWVSAAIAGNVVLLISGGYSLMP
jgi:hypothetical protein